jgi:hypothetical protein
MKIHLDSCPRHPSQIGKALLEHCYCQVNKRHEATGEELLDEYRALPKWETCSKPERDYANALVAAICALGTT